MKQVYLEPRGGYRGPLRSDTLFGLIAYAVRQVMGRASVERFLAPAAATGAAQDAPLYLTSAFPWLESGSGRVHFFPAPIGACTAGDRAGGFIEDTDLAGFIAGQHRTVSCSPLLEGVIVHERRGSRGATHHRRGGLFFLASGPMEHYLEAALGFLERFGFGGGGNQGLGAFDVEMQETEFLRMAQPGEVGILLSLMLPNAAERAAMAPVAQKDARVAWRLERRAGYSGGRLSAPAPKRPVAMLAEGSIVPRAESKACGAAVAVGTGSDEAGEFGVLQHGFGFLLPLPPAATDAAHAAHASEAAR